MVFYLGTRGATGVLTLALSYTILMILAMVPMITSTQQIAWLYVAGAIGAYTVVCISAGSVIATSWESKEDYARRVEGKMNR